MLNKALTVAVALLAIGLSSSAVVWTASLVGIHPYATMATIIAILIYSVRLNDND